MDPGFSLPTLGEGTLDLSREAMIVIREEARQVERGAMVTASGGQEPRCACPPIESYA
jgi:hypothetical protein